MFTVVLVFIFVFVLDVTNYQLLPFLQIQFMYTCILMLIYYNNHHQQSVALEW